DFKPNWGIIVCYFHNLHHCKLIKYRFGFELAVIPFIRAYPVGNYLLSAKSHQKFEAFVPINTMIYIEISLLIIIIFT
ncbi:MAG: hypothetical protein ACTSU6_04365, partial [Candidatus Njordarchaeales archaeon]